MPIIGVGDPLGILVRIHVHLNDRSKLNSLHTSLLLSSFARAICLMGRYGSSQLDSAAGKVASVNAELSAFP